ncbi:hypothetical protein CSKR_107247 [Clonorchis sinensis]|uniref:Uncharacterized protein n=1 Tax=Clonorchis sinensis TaxID=79923 RepID=A0A3R7JNJ9_CLOSI|nr:hypothetical protein CSKR_107247 [Clonorchis sinensis]
MECCLSGLTVRDESNTVVAPEFELLVVLELLHLEICGIGILSIFTSHSFERSSSLSGESTGLEFCSSAVHIQWPCRDLNPGHLTCEANVLPLLHQRTLDAFEFLRLNRRT